MLVSSNNEEKSFIKLHTLRGRIEKLAVVEGFQLNLIRLESSLMKKNDKATDCPFILSMIFT